MPKHPRLSRRGATYYHRAAIPADIADSYPVSGLSLETPGCVPYRHGYHHEFPNDKMRLVAPPLMASPK